MTLDPDFKVTALFERQITTTWYNIELYLQWQSNNKSYYDLSNGAIFNVLERTLPRFQGHAIIWCWISQIRYEIHSFNAIL